MSTTDFGKPDVIVVGAGNAACCAALAARENGASVIMLEAAPVEDSGGNSRYTGGLMRVVYNGVEDLKRKLRADWRGTLVTTIQAFQSMGNLAPLTRDNVISMVDECHRSQKGDGKESFAMTMRVKLANGFRYAEGLALFRDRIRCIPEAAAALKQIAQDNLAKVDGHLAGREYLCGKRFTMADMLLYAFLDFAQGVNQPLDPAKKNLKAWFDRIAARPSADASLNPAAVNAGLRG